MQVFRVKNPHDYTNLLHAIQHETQHNAETFADIIIS